MSAPTATRAGCASGSRASCRASASGRSCTAWPRELGSPAGCGNDAGGVVIEVEGERRASTRFLRALRGRGAAAGAWSSAVRPSRRRRRAATRGFAIAREPRAGGAAALVVARRRDLRRLPARALRPADRRYRYPFINCTELRAALHDHPRRPLRPAAHDDGRLRHVRRCRAEYEDPATGASTPQPNACPPAARGCGWSATRRRAAATPSRGRAALCAGAIVAVKGLGGFHLACGADDERGGGSAARAQAPRGQAVRGDGARPRGGARARARSTEPRTRAAASRGAADRARAAAAPARAVAAAVAPALARELGVMLPYTPLHHLLLADVGVPLVMTCGNVSDEPIAYRRRRRPERLAGDRRRASSLTTARSTIARRRLRRARRARAGRCRPAPLARLRARPRSRCRCARAPPLLACGAELKNTFCVARGPTRVPRPPHRRPRARRDPAPFRDGHRALRAAVRRRSPRSSRTTCTPTTSPPVRARARRASSTSACSTITRTSPRAWPSTA